MMIFHKDTNGAHAEKINCSAVELKARINF